MNEYYSEIFNKLNSLIKWRKRNDFLLGGLISLPLSLLIMLSFSSCFLTGGDFVPPSRLGKRASGMAQTQVQTAQMTNPIHHAPIHLGSFWFMSGSVDKHNTTFKLSRWTTAEIPKCLFSNISFLLLIHVYSCRLAFFLYGPCCEIQSEIK